MRRRARQDSDPHAGLVAGISVALTLAAALTVGLILTVISAGLSVQTMTAPITTHPRVSPGER